MQLLNAEEAKSKTPRKAREMLSSNRNAIWNNVSEMTFCKICHIIHSAVQRIICRWLFARLGVSKPKSPRCMIFLKRPPPSPSDHCSSCANVTICCLRASTAMHVRTFVKMPPTKSRNGLSSWPTSMILRPSTSLNEHALKVFVRLFAFRIYGASKSTHLNNHAPRLAT